MSKGTVIKTLKVEVRGDGVLKLAGGLDKVKKSAKEASGQIDRVNKGVGEVANGTKNFSKQAQGLGGFVRAYATVAAHVFALSAAFNILKVSADLSAMEESAKSLAQTTGINFAGIARNLKEISEGALTFADSMRIANLATSAGISNSGLQRLSEIGVKAATVLGRNVPDSINRLVQAVVKGEPELIDEFGIILRLTDASEKYGESIGKAAKDLSTFEKSQAILNQVLEQGEQKYGNIVVAAKPYQKLSAEFLDIGQKILSVVTGPLTGIVTFLANNSSLIVVAIIALVTAVTKLAIPAITDLGRAFDDRLSTSIQKSTINLAELRKEAERSNNSLNARGVLTNRKDKIGNSIRDRLEGDSGILGFKKGGKSPIAEAITKDLKGAAFLREVNTSIKPFIASLKYNTRNAIQKGVSSVRFNNQNISVGMAKDLIAAYETSTKVGQKLIQQSVKTGLAKTAVNFRVFSARFKATTVQMGRELALGLQAGLSATTFKSFAANMRAILGSGTVTSKLAVGLGAVAKGGQLAFSAFSKILPVVTGLLIAFQGFKFIAKQVGLLTDSYKKFNEAISEGSKILKEQDEIQKGLIESQKEMLKKQAEGGGDLSLSQQVSFIDGLVNSFSTLESAAEKISEAARELNSLSGLDRLLSFIMGKGTSAEASVEKQFRKMFAQAERATGVDILSQDNVENMLNSLGDRSLLEPNPSRISSYGPEGQIIPGLNPADYKAALAVVRKNNKLILDDTIFFFNKLIGEAGQPLRDLQANFKAVAESSKAISSNMAASLLSITSASRASKPLRDINVGLAALDNIPSSIDNPAAQQFTRDKAELSFLKSLSSSAKRYFGVVTDANGVILNSASAMEAIRAEKVRLTAKVISDLTGKGELTSLKLQLKGAKKLSSLEATNVSLIKKRRDIEASILSNRIRTAQSAIAETARLWKSEATGSANKEGLKLRGAAQSRTLASLKKQREELTGISRELEIQKGLSASILQDSNEEVQVKKQQLSIAQVRLKASNRLGTSNSARLQAQTQVNKASIEAGKLEVLLLKQSIVEQTKLNALERELEQRRQKGAQDSLTLQAKVAKANSDKLRLQLLELSNQELILYNLDKEFELQKKNASFSVFGSDNRAALQLFGIALTKESQKFTDNMSNDVDRMVSALTKTSDAFTNTLVDGFAGDTSITDSIKEAFIAGAKSLHEQLKGFLKEDLKSATRKLFGELFTATNEEKMLSLTERGTIAVEKLAAGDISGDPSQVQTNKKTTTMFTTVTTKIKDIFGGLWSSMKSLFSGLWSRLSDSFSSIFRIMTSTSSMASSGGSGGILGSLVSAAIGAFTGGGISAGITSASGATSFGLGDTSAFQGVEFFAKGGIATKPSIAGEGALNEAVVPLPDGRTIPVSMTGGGGDISVVVNVDVGAGTSSTEVQGQQAEQYKTLGIMVSNAVKGEIIKQKRPGGLLA